MKRKTKIWLWVIGIIIIGGKIGDAGKEREKRKREEQRRAEVTEETKEATPEAPADSIGASVPAPIPISQPEERAPAKEEPQVVKVPEPRQVQVPPKKPNKPTYDLEISAIDLMKAYVDNAIRADVDYRLKRIRVYGDVKSVGRTLQGLTYVTLDAGNATWQVQGLFSPTENPSVADLTTGQRVMMEGTCTGKQLNVILEACVIVY